MDNNKRKELLKKLKKSQLSPAEKRELWDLHTGLQEEAAHHYDEPDLESLAAEEITAEMEAALLDYKLRHDRMIRRQKQQKILRIMVPMAAMLLLYLGFTKYADQLFEDDQPTFLIVQTNSGETKKITLPDSSQVTIGSGSVLRYPEAFENNERKIFLEKGEAFFQVAKDPQKPFRVLSGDLQTTALGTSFTVQYDPIAKREKINLFTGKVSVAAKATKTPVNPVVLTPGKAFEYLSGKIKISDFNTQNGNPIDKGLIFENVPFDEAMFRISSWYGINMIYDKDDTHNRWINGNFKNKEIEDILFILSDAYNLNFTKTDSVTYKIMQTKK